MILKSFLNVSVWLAVLTLVVGWLSIEVVQAGDLVADVEKLATLEGSDRQEFADSILVRVQEDTADAIAALLPKLSDSTVDDTSLGMFITILGSTKTPRATADICRLAESHRAGGIRYSCWTALANIGTNEAGECLLSSLDSVADREERFVIFDALGQMQYGPAMPVALEVLESDAEKEYWHSIFVFGKMGDAAVPYLIEKVGDENRNIRYNAISVLGAWLMAPEATDALREQFWKEKDPLIRNLILSSLEKTSLDEDSLLSFMKEVKSKSKDKDARTFADESINLFAELSSQISAIHARKKISPEEFQRAYQEIWDSYGKDGDYDLLLTSSDLSDEPALKRLRERVLQRDSDESFYDYIKVNEIISTNRYLYQKD